MQKQMTSIQQDRYEETIPRPILQNIQTTNGWLNEDKSSTGASTVDGVGYVSQENRCLGREYDDHGRSIFLLGIERRCWLCEASICDVRPDDSFPD